jgi:hypothetical protein
MQQYLADSNVNKQYCCARNNGRACLWFRVGCLWTSTDTTVGSGDRLGADVCIWLWTPFEVGRLSSYRKLWEEPVSLYSGRWRHSIVRAGKWRVNDVYTEVPLWSASGPIAQRWIDLVCLEALWLQEWEWVLEDYHKRSCWKNSIGVGVPRPCGSDLYVCSKSCRLCLTVVYWLLECNKVPSWIEPRVRYNIISKVLDDVN